ncbi:hypothetical protein KFU94_53735 [Chloroflexi bacterium TSY]|nr:hypothetical protein [Chloroflexi bacterium TSY]
MAKPRNSTPLSTATNIATIKPTIMPLTMPQKSRKQIDENQQTSPVSPLTTKTQTADDESTEQQDNPGDQNQQSASVSISTPIRIGSQANQMSLVLVGAIFVGLIMIVGLVLGRRR